MAAYMTIVTNAEGQMVFDLEDILIHNDGILEYLIFYLFDNEEGMHKNLGGIACDSREVALRESGYIIESVDDGDDIAEHFFSTTADGINSFNLSDYEEVMGLFDSPSNFFKVEAVAAFLEWTNGSWSRSDFENTYEGEHNNDKSFVQSKTELDEVPEWVKPYFDWDQYASDEMGNYHEEAGHYFSCF